MGFLTGALVCLLLLLFTAAPAFAESASFGSEGSGAGQFKEPTGIAVNDTSGDVYVVDKGNNRVEYFSSSGTYLGQFDGSETPAGSFSSPEGVAVDNSCVDGALECPDPSVLDVYVVDAGHHVIDKFSPTGAYLGQLTGSTTPGASFSGRLGVAVDRSGNVWVEEEDGTIYEFDDTTTNSYLNQIATKCRLSPGIALSATDQVYVITAQHALSRLTSCEDQVDLSPPTPTSGCQCATGVGVDVGASDIYVDERTRVTEYSSSGELIQQLGWGPGELTRGAGIAVNSRTETVYVADSAASVVRVFNPVPLSVPLIGNESSSGVTSTSAKLEAQMRAGGEATNYFEYGTAPCEGNSCGTKTAPEGGPVVGDALEPVSFELTGLKPNTTYHWWAVAKNTQAPGGVHGEAREFTTPKSAEEVATEKDAEEHEAALRKLLEEHAKQAVEEVAAMEAAGKKHHEEEAAAAKERQEEETAVVAMKRHEEEAASTPLGVNAVTPKAPTKAQKLAKALAQCKREPKRKRSACVKQAKKQYGSKAKGKK